MKTIKNQKVKSGTVSRVLLEDMPRLSRGEDTKAYQNKVIPVLKRIFGEHNVRKEWDVAKDAQDDYTRELYCPRIDVAVGPFNIDDNVGSNNLKIESALVRHKPLLARVASLSEMKVGGIDEFLAMRNRNPRCLLGIEIENSGTRKHRFGDIANASIMGAVGIVVPLNQETLNSFVKLLKYISFVTNAGKLRPSFNNVVVLSRTNFLKLLCRSRFDSIQ